MIKELQAECIKVKKEQEAAAAVAARKKNSLAVPLSSSSSLPLFPPPFDPERDGLLGAATALSAALLGWSLSLSPRYTPLAALWSILAAAAAVDASLHAAVAAGARRTADVPSSTATMTVTPTGRGSGGGSSGGQQRPPPRPLGWGGLLLRVKHETPAAARASLRSHPVARRPRRPPQEEATGGRRGRAKSPSPSPAAAANADLLLINPALWHVPRGAAAASKRLKRRERYETLAALLVLLVSCAMALAVVAFLGKVRHGAISVVATTAKRAFASVRAKKLLLLPPLRSPPPATPPPPPPLPSPPALPAFHLPETIARYFPEMPTLAALPALLPSLPSFAVPVPVSAGARSLRRSLERTLARSSAKVRPALESCVAAASGVSSVLRAKGIEALSAAQPTLGNLEHSLKSAIDSSSATFAASHAALRRVTGRKGPQAKLWFQ